MTLGTNRYIGAAFAVIFLPTMAGCEPTRPVDIGHAIPGTEGTTPSQARARLDQEQLRQATSASPAGRNGYETLLTKDRFRLRPSWEELTCMANANCQLILIRRLTGLPWPPNGVTCTPKRIWHSCIRRGSLLCGPSAT